MKMELGQAERLARRVVAELKPLCERIEVAGSIRRRCPEVGDIDLVLIPRDLEAVVARVSQNCVFERQGRVNLTARFKSGFQLDLFVARAAAADLLAPLPSNWGTILLCRTGSMEHNAGLASYAIGKTLHWDPYRGLLRGGEVIAGASEEEIYEALGLEWIEPRERARLSLNGSAGQKAEKPVTHGIADARR